MSAQDYSGFILAAYGLSALALAVLAAWILVDARRQRRELAALERSGVRRRSAGDAS